MPEWFRMIDHIDGGAGALLSHGLLETMNASVYEACVTSGDGIASDYLFSYCMWQSGCGPRHSLVSCLESARTCVRVSVRVSV